MSELIVKDNVLINASYSLDLIEQRLILLSIIEARESGKGINEPLIIHADSYINQFKVHRTTAYQALKNASKELFNRQFSYQETRGNNLINITSRWVSQIGYVENLAVIELIFSPAVVPLITKLEKHFTKYEFDQISDLSSAYAIRMYEILISWRSTGRTPIISLEVLKNRLGILEKKYTRIERFKKNIIEASIIQVNKHTDIIATYTQHKEGRKIVGFSFNFSQKKIINNKIGVFPELTESQIKKYSIILSKLPDLADLSNFSSYYEFSKWISQILRNPNEYKRKISERVFKSLYYYTDFE